MMQERPVGRQRRAQGERRAQGGALVVVARQHPDRHGKRCQQIEQIGVLRRPAGLGEIAGDQQQVGPRPERRKAPDAAPEKAVGVDAIERQRAGLDHVKVGDLGNQHDSRTSLPERSAHCPVICRSWSLILV